MLENISIFKVSNIGNILKILLDFRHDVESIYAQSKRSIGFFYTQSHTPCRFLSHPRSIARCVSVFFILRHTIFNILLQKHKSNFYDVLMYNLAGRNRY